MVSVDHLLKDIGQLLCELDEGLEHQLEHSCLEIECSTCCRQEALDLFFRKQDNDFVNSVFERNMNTETKLLPICALKPALSELGVKLESEESATSLFHSMDVNDDGGLDREEFERVIQMPTKLEQWAATIPMQKLLASCIPIKAGDDPLRAVTSLDVSGREVVEQVFCTGFRRLFAEYVDKLKKLYSEMDKKASEQAQGLCSKFTFVPSSGDIADFHEGLKGRVGMSAFQKRIRRRSDILFVRCSAH
jgi:hypothetical protein